MRCQARYEPDARRDATHTCDLPDEHDTPHHCPLCGGWWSRPGGPVERGGDAS